MKITLIRQDSGSGKEALSICEAGTLFNKMKTETKSGHITALRNLIPMLEGTYSQYEHIDKLPYIYSAVECTRTKEGERKMKQYNGLVQLEVNRLAGPSEMEYVKRQAALLPQTFAAFCGSSGRSVKIWVRFALPDDRGLPEKEAEAELFHAHAYWLAVKCYQPMLPYDINLQAPVLTQKCRMTLDESPYYNPDAVPFCLEQPLAIPEEEAVRQTLIHYYREEDERIIRSTIHNLYQECKGFGKKNSIGREQETAFLLEEFMNRRYEFRYNTVLDDLEYRQRDSIHFYFKPVDKRVRNSISICALKEGINAWDRDVDRFLNSEYVPLHNPVEEYLYDVGRWDGKDRIRALAGLVPCTNPYWQELFYRWFLSMVAHWRGVDRQHGNSTSPLLVGPQGYRKSTFCRIILPPELRFGYTDSIDFKSKQEAERYLGRFFLINIDEFDQINLSQQGFLKHLLQKPVANLRKPHGNTIREMRRYASFIGTSNQKDLLADPSGSRRFICIEVIAPIKTNATINYKQLYAQAMEAIYKGERYWLDDEDEKILKQTNREFEQASPLEQLFHCYLRPAEEEEGGEWMTSMQILNYLQTKTRDRLAINKVAVFGRALQKLNIPCRKSGKGTLYHLLKIE